MAMNWAALDIDVSSDHEDLACWLLIKCGAAGCEVNALPDGERITIRATFDTETIADTVVDEIKSSLEEYELGESLRTLRFKNVEQQDWLAKFKEGFEPFRVGTKFLICPSWYLPGYKDDYPEELKRALPNREINKTYELDSDLLENRIAIFIEPGMAFGTGLHATTQFCLRAMESFLPRGKILDVGTGSGILAIAALKLNPTCQITAVDIDQVAVDFAQKDFELNGMDGRIELLQGSTDVVNSRRFDMLLSNLTCEDIIALLGDYNVMLKSGGYVLCAGILAEKLDRLEKELPRNHMRIVQSEQVGHWVGVVLEKL